MTPSLSAENERRRAALTGRHGRQRRLNPPHDFLERSDEQASAQIDGRWSPQCHGREERPRLAPEVAPEIVGIVIGSMGKGLVAGVLIGWFAKRVNNLAMRIALGLIVGSLTRRYGTRASVRWRPRRGGGRTRPVSEP